jgi:hypothetical protein
MGKYVNKTRTVPRSIVGSDIPVFSRESGEHLASRLGLDLHELCEAAAGSGYLR